MANDEIQVDLIIRKHLFADLMLFLGGTVKVIKVSSVAGAPAATAPQPTPADSADWRATVIGMLKSSPMKKAEIAKAMGKTPAAVGYYLNTLRGEKKIKLVPGNRWRVI